MSYITFKLNKDNYLKSEKKTTKGEQNQQNANTWYGNVR